MAKKETAHESTAAKKPVAKASCKKPTKSVATKKTSEKNDTPALKQLKLVKSDEWLAPFAPAIEGRHQHVIDKMTEITGGKQKLSEFATGYLYYGLHREEKK